MKDTTFTIGYYNINKFDFLSVMFWLILYRLILDLLYINWISPNFSYYGFNYSPSENCILFSWLGTVVFGVLVNDLLKKDSATNNVLIFFVLLYYYPLTSLFAYQNNNLSYYFYASSYFLFLMIYNKIVSLPKIVQIQKGNEFIFDVSIFIIGLIMILISGYFTGFRISFDLSEYYVFRDEVIMYRLPSIVSYLFFWGMKIIPIGLCYAIVEKKKWLVIFCIFAQILGFSFNGKKSVFFMLFLVLGISVFYKDRYRKKLPFIFCISSLVSLFESLINGENSFLVKHFIRRLMYVPAYLGEKYYEFFSNNEFDYWRSSILRRLDFKSPYIDGIPTTMGYYVYGNNANANTGLCGDAFANFGWFSLLFYPLILIIAFKIMDQLLDNIDSRISMVICFSNAYAFLSGTFFSVLMTNGYIILCLLMAIYPRTAKSNLMFEAKE